MQTFACVNNGSIPASPSPYLTPSITPPPLPSGTPTHSPGRNKIEVSPFAPPPSLRNPGSDQVSRCVEISPHIGTGTVSRFCGCGGWGGGCHVSVTPPSNSPSPFAISTSESALRVAGAVTQLDFFLSLFF